MSNVAYYKRRQVLYETLRRYEFATCADLAIELGWSSNEVRGKLQSLRTSGLVYYDAPEWHDEDDGSG